MTALTEQQAYEAIAAQWAAIWEPLHPRAGFPYCLENEAFVEPDVSVSWARIELHPLDSVQETLGAPGGRQYRRDAEVWVWLYTPTNKGKFAINGLIDDARKVFEGQSFGGIDPAGGVRVERTQTDGRWYEVVVISPIQYYETR